MWAFLTAAEEMRQQFSSGRGKTEMGWSRLALIQVRAAGADLYERLGLDGSDWATVPDVPALGAGTHRQSPRG